MSIGRHWKYLSRFSHLYSRINLILMGMLTLERGSAECREGENWRWCCKLNFRAAAWKIQHYTMQELMVHFLQLLVTSESKIGSFLSLACNVHSWLKLFLMDWLFLCICSFTRYFFFHLYKVFSYFSVQNSENIFEEFLVHLLSARNITMQLSNFSNRKIRWTLNSLRMWLEFCLQCDQTSEQKKVAEKR